MKISSTDSRILADVGVPARERGQRVGDVPAVSPRLSRPTVLLDHGDKFTSRWVRTK